MFSGLGVPLTDHGVDEMRSYIAPVGAISPVTTVSECGTEWRREERLLLAGECAGMK